jgi:carboxyl-terminal processing protease
MNHRRITVLLVCLLLAVILLAAGKTLARRSGVFDQIDLLVDLRHEIVSEYVEEPDQKKMIEAAVRGMVDALNDPYTVYLAPEDLAQFDKAVRGTFSGIGAEIAIEDNHLKIVSPLEGSPAWKAGVMAGDVVLEIDGKTTEGIKINEAIDRLTGPEGTQVAIKVRHENGESSDLTITRARINIQTVRGIRRKADQKWDFMLDPKSKIGYVRITQFTEGTAEALRQALDELQAQEMRGLILDLRFNGGGLLEAASKVCDDFLTSGQTIVSIKGRAVPERVIKAHTDGTIKPVPMVVLCNEASASASEIVAGALKDNGRAKYIGTRSFGKGSVQQVKMLDSGQGAIKITNAYYYLPSGRNIHRREGKDTWGVDPDDGYYVPMTTDQMRKMLEKRREGEIIKDRADNAEPEAVTPEMIEKDLADPQLAAGLRAVLGKLDKGEWPIVGKSNASELAKLTKKQGLIRQRELLQERLTEIEKELGKLEEAPGDKPAADGDKKTDADKKDGEKAADKGGDKSPDKDKAKPAPKP